MFLEPASETRLPLSMNEIAEYQFAATVSNWFHELGSHRLESEIPVF
jgi:hypothetical protein